MVLYLYRGQIRNQENVISPLESLIQSEME
jgi:hypothetical protein